MDTKGNEDELITAKKHITLQNKKLEKYSKNLIRAHKKNNIHYIEKVRRESELVIANRLLVFENKEKGKRAEELATANKTLIFENAEKKKRAEELVIANKKLIFENKEKRKRAEELVIANKTLIFENAEKKKRAEELVIANSELIKAETLQKEHIETLEEMMFIISHKVRNPVANILGISYLLEDSKNNSSQENKKFIESIIESAKTLNMLTQELSTCIHTKRNNQDYKT